MAIHLIVSESEQLAIVNALAFYNDFHAASLDRDGREQWQLGFKEDNRGFSSKGPVDVLATKIANSH